MGKGYNNGKKYRKIMTNNLQAILTKKGISQSEFARMIGKPASQVNDWCLNKKLIGIRWAFKIKKAVGLESIEELFLI